VVRSASEIGARYAEGARYEVKMTCDATYLSDMRAWIRSHPDSFVEAYRPRRVNSLYLDTYGADCFGESIVGVNHRTKVRFRWYGDDHASASGVVELKRRSGRVGWKESHEIAGEFDLTAMSWLHFVRQLQSRADDRLVPWLSTACQPMLITSYMREYYESIDGQVRLTLDHDLAAYEQVMQLTPNLSMRAPDLNRIIVEVKGDAALHRRLSAVLSSLPLVVARNSKYVNGITASLSFA